MPWPDGGAAKRPSKECAPGRAPPSPPPAKLPRALSAARPLGRYVSLTLSPTSDTSLTAMRTLMTTQDGSNSNRPMLNLGLDG